MADQTYDVVVVGASLGGVAAALRAAHMGAAVCLLESSDWVGGQYSSQGVCKPDDNAHVETTGSTASYRAFRHGVRQYYRTNRRLSAHGAAQPELNPGGDYPGFAVEPRVAHGVLQAQLLAAPNLHLRLRTTAISAEVAGDTVVSITANDAHGTPTRYLAKFFLDATDLGDLLPLAGVEYRLGAESKAAFGEANAPAEAHPDWLQPFTMVFAVERRPAGEDHTIPKPAEYDALAADQRYRIEDGAVTTMFGPGENMFNYRQFIAAANFEDPAFPYDLTTINTGSNDAQTAPLPSGDPARDAALIERGRQASLGYLYWLQTECPHPGDPGAKGYPELKLRPDVFGTPDGCSAQPYVREGRRIEALTTVVQHDIDVNANPGPRARPFADSCGIGFYGSDIHPNRKTGLPWSWISTKPYQIPVGALIPVRVTNLLAACKNIGVTHLTNGAYRLHPIEWNVGESAGALAAFCLAHHAAPRDVPKTPALLRAYRHALLAAGIPLYWWSDVAFDAAPALFAAAHLLGVEGIMTGAADDLRFGPDDPLTYIAKHTVDDRVGRTLDWPASCVTRGEAALWLVGELGL